MNTIMKTFSKFSTLLMVLLMVACSKTNEIKVISYNVRYMGNPEADKENYWDNRKHASINMVNDEMPIVMGVQEALYPQMQYLAENLPDYDHYGAGRDDGKQEGEYTAIFYKKDAVEMLDKGIFWLSETPEIPSLGWDAACFRTCTWAVFKCKDTGKEFAFFNTHLDHKGKKAQEMSMKAIVQKIKEVAHDDMPVFLTGDFNSHTDSPIYAPLDSIMNDARVVSPVTDLRGTSNGWKKEDNSSVIDHIFVRNAQAKSFSVLRDKDYGVPFISDHYPVVTVVEF